MSSAAATEVAVVGAGVCGLLVARELVRAGHEVTVVERGGRKAHSEQLEDGLHAVEIATAAHNHEAPPGAPEAYPWDYVYGVGGSSLHWAGVTPRFLPSDFELRSRYGVGSDWPLTYRELEPFYDAAEEALSVAGGPNPLFAGRMPHPQPPHPFSPVDRIIKPMLEPYVRLAQARPTRAVRNRPACCASAQCRLCPVDARYSALHILDDGLDTEPGFRLRDRTIVTRLRTAGGRVSELDCVDAAGERSVLRAERVVLAANGVENAAVLLRSGLEGSSVGRYLYDHNLRVLEFETDRPVGHGRGRSLATGVTYAYADEPSRSERSSVLLSPHNPGTSVVAELYEALLRGDDGARTRRRLRQRFERTLVLDLSAEDLPRRDRFVSLSATKDSFGLPLNRIAYGKDGPYLEKSLAHVRRDLERRLRPLGARLRKVGSSGGGHQLGTCRMGPPGEGVVDENGRHHELANLFVTGGSAFPSYSSAGPTLTIAALAIRLGRHMAARG